MSSRSFFTTAFLPNKLFFFLSFATGVFYYVIGNIRPIFRSTLRNIHLICVAKSKDIKEYGVDKLIMPFVEEVNKLSQVLVP